MDKYSTMLKNDQRYHERQERLNSFLRTKGQFSMEKETDLPDVADNARWLDHNAEECEGEHHAAMLDIHNDPKLPPPYVYTPPTAAAGEGE